MKQSFPYKQWLDIFSKSDLLTAHFQTADVLRQNDASSASSYQPLTSSSASDDSNAQHNLDGHPDATSAVAEQGISETDGKNLRGQKANNWNQADVSRFTDRKIDDKQQADTLHADAHCAGDSSIATSMREEQEAWGGALDPANTMQEVVQAVLALPAALRISSVTQEGIENLQLATMELLSSPPNSSVQQEVTR